MRSMWTVMQIMTFDMWATDIARPMNEVSPGIVVVILGTIVICSFGVLNVVVAVMVQQILTIAKDSNDKVTDVLEKTDKQILKAMADEFRSSDDDGNDELNYE